MRAALASVFLDGVAIVLTLEEPLDSQRDLRRPRASADVDLVLEVELVP